MNLTKVTYTDNVTVIGANNLNDIQDAITDLEDETTDLKTDLERYEDIFTSDVDESVQNWLDEHPEATTTVQDGSLTIAKFADVLKKEMSIIYNTVAEMVADTSLIDGMTVMTLGYYEKNDGGGATYYIAGNVAEVDDILCVELANGLSAVLQTSFNCNALQFGCDNTGTNDCSTLINSISAFILKNNPVIYLNGDRGYGGGSIYFPKGTYLISNTVKAYKYVKYYGDKENTVFVQGTAAISGFKLDPDNTGEYGDGNGKTWNIVVENIIFQGFNVGVDFIAATALTIRNCKFINCGTGVQIRLGVNILIENVMCYMCTSHGIRIASIGRGPATTISIVKCWLVHCQSGLTLEYPSNGVDGLQVIDSIFEYNTYAITANFVINPTYKSFMEFIGCYFEGNSTISTFYGEYTCNIQGCFVDTTDSGIFLSGKGDGIVTGNTPNKISVADPNIKRFTIDGARYTHDMLTQIMVFRNKSSININDYLPTDTKFIEVTYVSDEYTAHAVAKITKSDTTMYATDMHNDLTNTIVANAYGTVASANTGTNPIVIVRHW